MRKNRPPFQVLRNLLRTASSFSSQQVLISNTENRTGNRIQSRISTQPPSPSLSVCSGDRELFDKATPAFETMGKVRSGLEGIGERRGGLMGRHHMFVDAIHLFS